MKLVFIWLDIASGFRKRFHHGVASLAAYLKERRHEVSCIHIRNKNEINSVVETINRKDPDCVAFSLTTNQRKYLDSYAKAIRKNFKGLIIAGGVHPTLDPDDVLKCEEIDGICIGEGETPLSILGEYYDNQKDYFSTPSFWWRAKNNNGSIEIIKNRVLSFERELSSLPFSDYSIFDIDAVITEASGFFDIMISRGCPYNCTYCCNHAIKSIYSDTRGYFRILSSKKAIDLLEFYKNKYPSIRGFVFTDDLFFLNAEWLKDFSNEYQKKIRLPYICNGRFELMNKEIAEELFKSNCTEIMFGLESGDEKFRKEVLKRRYSDADIIDVSQTLHQLNIPFFTYNIFGFPFETKDQMRKTVMINKRIRPHSGAAFFFYPYPKTELYSLCEKYNLLKKDEMDSVSGYREKPVIKLTNCKESDCIRLQQELQLYFMVRRLFRIIHVDNKIVEALIIKILSIFPSFIVKLFTYENPVKAALRKLMYRRMRK